MKTIVKASIPFVGELRKALKGREVSIVRQKLKVLGKKVSAKDIGLAISATRR